MTASLLYRTILAAGSDALRCLFTEALPSRGVLLANLAVGWPEADVTALSETLDALLASGRVVPSVSTPGRYRLRLDILNSRALLAPPRVVTALESIQEPVSSPPMPRFSYFQGGICNAGKPYAAITPAQLYQVLTSTRHRARTDALRAAPVGSPQRDALKRGLDYVIPAGTFARRAIEGLEKESGLLVLDFDHVPDLTAARAALLTDKLLSPEWVLLFTSPSGDGIKVLARAEASVTHSENFRAYADYLGRVYGTLNLRPDETGKDVCRACFVPYAPDAWLAPAYATDSHSHSETSQPEQI